MPNVNAQFQGQTLIRPGAYYADDVTGTATTNPGFIPPLILIGYGFGGAPLVPTTYDTAQDLLTALRGGPLADFVPFISNPSTQLNGASQITYINASTNTQATLTLSSNATTPAPLLDVTTVDYGSPSNLMQIGIDQASNGLTGARLITLFNGFNNEIIQGDNLGVPFTLAYTGATTGVTVTVTKVSNLATVLTITSTGVGESVSIPLGSGQYSTVAAVVGYLNGTGFYSAIAQNDGGMASANLDAAAAVALPVPVAGVPVYVPVTAYAPDAMHWFAQYAGDMVTCALHASVVTGPTSILGLIPLTHFTGGTNVPPVLADYGNAFNVALGIPGWAVFADSNLLGVQALGTQHAIQASSVSGRRPRRFFTGSTVGDTPTSAVVAAQGLDSTTTTYAYPGIQRTNTATGRNQVYGGLYVAAAAAGMASGNRVAEPLTSKPLVGNGVEMPLTDSQIDALQRGGVMPIARNDAGVPIIVSDLTTWQNDSNPENVFNQQVACRQYLNYLLVGTAQPYIGQVAYLGGLGIVRNAIVAALNGAIFAPGNNGVLVSWDPKSLSLIYTGATQTLAIQVNVVFVGQIRFITIYVPVQPLNLTA